LATLLRKYNLRSFAFPFDWTVTYNGVARCFEDNFKLFVPTNNERIDDYDIFFMHDFIHDLQADKIKYKRRIDRMMEILETTTETVTFIRKGHAPHHHGAHNRMKSDLAEAEELATVLSRQFKQLNYKIIVILVCGSCFDTNMDYTTKSNNIEIHKIITDKVDDEKFEDIFCKIFDKRRVV
jgi:hypothetical protein